MARPLERHHPNEEKILAALKRLLKSRKGGVEGLQLQWPGNLHDLFRQDREPTHLKISLLFHLLDEVGVTPEQFFGEVYGLVPADGAAGKSEGESIEDAVVRTLRRMGITGPAAGESKT